MFTPILLVCLADMSVCFANTDGSLFKTEKECYDHLAKGIALFESANYVIDNYRCVDWGSKT